VEEGANQAKRITAQKKSLFKHLHTFRRIADRYSCGHGVFQSRRLLHHTHHCSYGYTTYRDLTGFKQRRMPQKRCNPCGTFRVSAFRDWHRGNRNARDPGFWAGSAAYAVCETFGWHASLESKPRNARKFYYVIAFATILGVSFESASRV